MRVALGLARRGAGRTWPNPNVGCVLVRDGRLLGRGWTQPGGRPHAETVALAQAGAAAAGAIAYVTLEPCAHHAGTPPCAEALVAAGIATCVIAIVDPDPRVDGGGIAILERAGIVVHQGICATEAAWEVRGFLSRIEQSRPWVTLKLASSLDGRITAADGRSQWITGPQARAHGHLLRAGHDVILTGMGTVRADDPALSCRVAGLEDRSPVRAVIASGGDFPLQRQVFAARNDTGKEAPGRTGSAAPVWLLHGPDLPPQVAAELDRRGVTRIPLPGDPRPAPPAALQALAERGVTGVLIEGGAALATAFLKAGLVDCLSWYRAGHVLGGDGLAAFGALPPADLDVPPRWHRRETLSLGIDVLETYVRSG